MTDVDPAKGADCHLLKGFLFHERTGARIYVGICGEKHTQLEYTKDESSVTCELCQDRLPDGRG